MGVPGQCSMTIENTSSILATLMLDLRQKEDDYEDFNCLEIEYLKRGNEEEQESEIMESVDEYWEQMEEQEQHPQGNNNNNKEEPMQKKLNESLDQLSEESSDDGSQGQQEHKSSRHYKIVAKPHKRYEFKLSFTPKDVKTYSFELPLTLLGIGKLPMLTRVVSGVGLKPKFLIDPQDIDFKKKIIQTADKAVPHCLDIQISNPDNETIDWEVDESVFEEEGNQKVFYIQPVRGKIDGGQTLPLKASFNPIRA